MKMAIIYPNDEEIKFRKGNDGFEIILNGTVECAICNGNLLNEIILKKMIMVHKNYLVLCCYNCFYQLCEGNEFSCILCGSIKELSNCEKCFLNVCKGCIENNKINGASNGNLKKCFNCVPCMLWKKRADAVNVLTLFSSQLDMPNSLLVNEIECDQTTRKYLIKESKIGQNPLTNGLKDLMCINFLMNSFKLSVFNKLSEYSPNNYDVSSINECSHESIQICGYILEQTCSTLSNFKRTFNLDSVLSPNISAMMKSLLMSADENDRVISNSRLNKNVEKVMKNTLGIQSLNNLNNKKRKDSNKKHSNGENSQCTQLSSLDNMYHTLYQKYNIKECSIVMERLDDSVLSKSNMKPIMLKDSVNSMIVPHPNLSQEFFSDIKNNEKVCSDEEEDTSCLTNCTEKTNKKAEHKKTKSKNNTIVDTKSDYEKKINKPNRIDSSSKKRIKIRSGTEDHLTINKNSEVKKSSKIEDKLELINKNIESINENNSDDHPIIEGIKLCLPASKDNKDCNNKKRKKNQFDYSEMKTTSNMSDGFGNKKTKESSSDDECFVFNSKSNSPLNIKLSLTSHRDSDSDFNRGDKRKRTSSNQSDSSSKFFKITPKKQRTSNFNKKSHFDFSDSGDSSENSSDDSDFVNNKKLRQISRISSNELSSINHESSYKRDDSSANFPKIKRRKNIHKLKTKKKRSELTQHVLFEEGSRLKRIEERQQLYNQIVELPRQAVSCEKLVLDFDLTSKKELVVVHPDLVKFLKPHQVEGVKFMWDSVFESLARIKVHPGNGSILAHCMGLGKTLQVVTLIHTLFRYPETGIKTVLIISPRAIIENWHNEFNKWLSNISGENNFIIYNFLESKTHESRKKVIQEWKKHHGVLILSYQLYKTVLNKSQENVKVVREGLVDPGPDLVICDEGHLIKNQTTAIARTIKRVKTLRRILLTGTPLQNNLKEYHCMVDFVRPNLLGSIKEFTNRFINPITDGQFSDSNLHDVRVMKKRSHVLHRMLKGFVQRCDYSVLTPFLPPKHEYVIYLKMSDKQIQLYRYFLNNHKQPKLFINYLVLQMIWTHPKLLKLYSKRIETNKNDKLKAIENNIVQDKRNNYACSTEVEPLEGISISVADLTRSKSLGTDHRWWKPLLSKNDLDNIHPYSKFLMMFSILKESEEIGDKVILFSQSLYTLGLIENMLNNADDFSGDNGGPYGKSWNIGEDYLRIDGSVCGKTREDSCRKFNDLSNTKLRLLLLSTKACNMGINLVGANRVIIFDVTWNPSLNVQSIFRVFRFGQNKPCFIYRLISEGTMEQKIYERQISKLSMAFRVVDEHQTNRHFNAKNQEELYEFKPNTSAPKSTLNLPKDPLMAELILKHKDIVINILEHDSLLQNNEAEELNESDRNAAWEDYQKEKDCIRRALENQPNKLERANQMNNQFNTFTNEISCKKPHTLNTLHEDVILFKALRNIFPQASLEKIDRMMAQVKKRQKKNYSN